MTDWSGDVTAWGNPGIKAGQTSCRADLGGSRQGRPRGRSGIIGRSDLIGGSDLGGSSLKAGQTKAGQASRQVRPQVGPTSGRSDLIGGSDLVGRSSS
ncbi:MAG: hypothetical protein LBB61_09050 [Treponema sp.]|jgi:hypothetical protein|nr:hypothetical protein [Treponema sp.]